MDGVGAQNDEVAARGNIVDGLRVDFGEASFFRPDIKMSVPKDSVAIPADRSWYV